MAGKTTTGSPIGSATGLASLDSTSVMSVALSVRLPATSTAADLVGQLNNALNADGWVLYYQNGLYGLVTFNGAASKIYTPALAIHYPQAGSWEHWIVSTDGGTVRWFRNGLRTGTQTQTTTWTVAGTRRTQLGGGLGWLGGSQQAMHDVRIWSGYAVTSPAEAAYIARGGVLGNEGARWFVGGSGMRDLTPNGLLLTAGAAYQVVADPTPLVPARRSVFRTAVGAPGSSAPPFSRPLAGGFGGFLGGM